MRHLFSTRLDRLQHRYAPDSLNGPISSIQHFINAFRRNRTRRNLTVLDIAAAASSPALFAKGVEDLDPRLQQAILDTNPSITQTRLFELDGNELQGAINAAKGKYFEYLVVDRLNTGEQVGDVILPTGYKAELAQSMTQPGWDLQIIGPDGGIAEYLQLKATDSVSYIKETLERYPDFQILATSEVARAADVLDSDINNRRHRHRRRFCTGAVLQLPQPDHSSGHHRCYGRL